MAAATAHPLTDEAREALEQTSTDALLTAFAALTHRIHAAAEDYHASAPRSTEERTALHRETDLRAQRDAIRLEILQRTGDA